MNKSDIDFWSYVLLLANNRSEEWTEEDEENEKLFDEYHSEYLK